MLGIVGLQWPEDSDCSQFPEEGGNATCLLPEAGVDGTTAVVVLVTTLHLTLCVVLNKNKMLLLFLMRCRGDRVLPQPLQVSVWSLRLGVQTLRRTPGL